MSNIVTVKTATGEVTLSPDTVRRYLVQGQGRVTDQEAMMFMALCKHQRLNPFLREAYLIKYGSHPATIVVGKEAYLKRARAIPQCRGYSAGVICMCGETGEFLRTKGFCPPKCILVGGWAQVGIADWDEPLEVEVSLNEYIGRTKDGRPNSMWAEKPATMIRKVALVQALREAFPAEFGGMYSQEEVPTVEDLPRRPIMQDQERSDTHEKAQSDGGDERGKEAVASTENGADGVDGTGQTEPGGDQADPGDPGGEATGRRRSRRNHFTVDAEIFNTPFIQTCGVTPGQLIKLKNMATNQAARDEITQAVKQMTGYEQWSFLRHEEAAELIERFTPLMARYTDNSDPDGGNQETRPDQPAQTTDAVRYIECPDHPGDRIDIAAYCLAGKCRARERDGWCPILGEEPPVSSEEVL